MKKLWCRLRHIRHWSRPRFGHIECMYCLAIHPVDWEILPQHRASEILTEELDIELMGVRGDLDREGLGL